MNENTPWLDRYTEEVIEPDLAICDPHHHLWNFPTSRYLVDEFLQDLGDGHRVENTVYVECQQHYYLEGPEPLKPVGETAYVDKVTRGSRRPGIAAGIIGYADMTLGEDVQQVLDAHMLASDRFRGIRHASAWHESDKVHNSHTDPVQGLLQDPAFRKGIQRLESMQLTFDAWLFFTQIPELIELARAFPGLTIILNHVGGPLGIGPYVNKREQVFKQWSADIQALSKCPNVVVKLGGLTMTMCGFGWHRRDTPPSSLELAEAMAPYYQHCIEHFGANRCMFESNFPVDKASCSYRLLWNAFKRLSREYSISERCELFHGTATRIYNLQN